MYNNNDAGVYSTHNSSYHATDIHCSKSIGQIINYEETSWKLCMVTFPAHAVCAGEGGFTLPHIHTSHTETMHDHILYIFCTAVCAPEGGFTLPHTCRPHKSISPPFWLQDINYWGKKKIQKNIVVLCGI